MKEFVDVAKRVDAIASEVIGGNTMLVRVQSSTPNLCGIGGMVDTLVLGTSVERHESSSLLSRTKCRSGVVKR